MREEMKTEVPPYLPGRRFLYKTATQKCCRPRIPLQSKYRHQFCNPFDSTSDTPSRNYPPCDLSLDLGKDRCETSCVGYWLFSRINQNALDPCLGLSTIADIQYLSIRQQVIQSTTGANYIVRDDSFSKRIFRMCRITFVTIANPP
jgi:hypothetical protein